MDKIIIKFQYFEKYVDEIYVNDKELKKLLLSLKEDLLLFDLAPGSSGLSQDISNIILSEEPSQNMDIPIPQVDFYSDLNDISIEESSLKMKPKSKEELLLSIKEYLMKNKIGKDIDYNINNENIKTMDIKHCIKSIQLLDSSINNRNRQQLVSYAILGETLENLKMLSPKTYMDKLKNNKIVYEKNYINFLIRFSKLAQKHNTLLEFRVSIYYVKTNIKNIEKLCIEEKW